MECRLARGSVCDHFKYLEMLRKHKLLPTSLVFASQCISQAWRKRGPLTNATYGWAFDNRQLTRRKGELR